MEFATWLTLFAACWAISLSPGAGAVAAMSAGLSHGFRRGYFMTFGLILGILTQVLFVSAGLGALIAAHKPDEVILTGKGLLVLTKDGALIRTLLPDASWVANACFGGSDGRRLFVTTRDRVMVFEVPGDASN